MATFFSNRVIHALEKKAGASQVKHFRPITIFSLIYRAWSSVRSRQISAFLTDQVPLKCFGNVPKKTAKDVWFGIQRQIEDHYFDNTPLTGCMLDLVKAFNHLPRLPVMKVGVTLGIAPHHKFCKPGLQPRMSWSAGSISEGPQGHL